MEELMEILTEINSDIDYGSCEDLLSGKQLDSLELLTLVVRIQEDLRVPIDPAEITAENFDSAERIMRLLEKHRQ